MPIHTLSYDEKPGMQALAESTKQCLRAYQMFTADHPDYEIDVKLCAFTASEMQEATKEHETFYRNLI